MTAGIWSLLLAGYLYRHRGNPGVRWFMLSFLAVGAWCLAYGVGLVVFDPEVRFQLERLAHIASFWVGPPFLLFTMEYTGRDTAVRDWQRAVVFAVPALGSGLVLTQPGHGLLWSEMTVAPVFDLATVSYTLEPLFFLITAYGNITAGVGVILLVETVVSYGPLYRREAAAVALSTGPPVVGYLLWLSALGPYNQLNLAPTLFLAHVALDSYAFVGSDMFETNPATKRAAERSAVDDIGSPVFVLDSANRVVTVNDAAADLFGLNPTAVLGEALTAFLDVEFDPAGQERQSVSVTIDSRDREFVVVTSPLTGPRDRNVGQTVVFQEVTREREREQRLDVLNRIIRHNLRNEMTVVLGHADIIANRAEDEQIRTSAEKITQSGDRLLTTGEKAREFEKLRKGTRRSEPVEIGALVVDVVADVRAAFPSATVDVTASGDGPTVETDPGVLSLVLSNLLENALTHAADDDPTVEITVTETDSGGVEIRIDDDGPGIETDELTPIRKGRETSLEHSTGIGLWVVSWGVSMLGGEIEFDTDDEGTAVSLCLD